MRGQVRGQGTQLQTKAEVKSPSQPAPSGAGGGLAPPLHWRHPSWGTGLLAVTVIVRLRGTTARACVQHGRCPHGHERGTCCTVAEAAPGPSPRPRGKAGPGSLHLGAKSLGHSKPGERTHAARPPGSSTRTQTEAERQETAVPPPGPERARADTAESRRGATRPVTGTAREQGPQHAPAEEEERGTAPNGP